ncbi:hypothetical protein FRC08_014708 [Ceratobasidium sp. 394]|nr:hypothetical protein FRC08_014708 [Ceratobasidium sp. 394]
MSGCMAYLFTSFVLLFQFFAIDRLSLLYLDRVCLLRWAASFGDARNVSPSCSKLNDLALRFKLTHVSIGTLNLLLFFVCLLDLLDAWGVFVSLWPAKADELSVY